MTSLSLSPSAISKSIAWIHFHKAGDGFNVDSWIPGFFTEDAVLNFANYPPARGWEEIRGYLGGQVERLESMRHDVGHIDVLPDRIYQEANITYVVKNDPRKEAITVRGFAVYFKGVEEERMHRFDVYGDFSKLGERIKECAELGTKRGSE